MFYLWVAFFVMGFRSRYLWVGYEYWRRGHPDACRMRAAHDFRSEFYSVYQFGTLPKYLSYFMRLAPNAVLRSIYSSKDWTVVHEN